jgi:hypothetical protein
MSTSIRAIKYDVSSSARRERANAMGGVPLAAAVNEHYAMACEQNLVPLGVQISDGVESRFVAQLVRKLAERRVR